MADEDLAAAVRIKDFFGKWLGMVEIEESRRCRTMCRECYVVVTADAPGVAPVAPLNHHCRGKMRGA